MNRRMEVSETQMITEKEYLYMITHVPGLGAVSVRRLKEYFGTYKAVWKCNENMLLKSGIVTEKRAKGFVEKRKMEDELRRSYEQLEMKGIRYITHFEADYPERLIPHRDSPAGLFVKGEIPDDHVPTVAIVGARNCTEYGKQAADYLAYELAKHDIQILSGLALGVDRAAHEGCLRASGKTFAVMGCGVNICYPRENYHLFHTIEESGGVISEFVPGTAPAAMNFPMRNRIISALSDAVIIVEARDKSGSLITGDLALEQGKEVFALPGRINDPLSAGCNRLLQMGAAVCLGPKDVLEFFGMNTDETLRENKKSEKSLAKRENMVYSFIDSRPKTLEEIVTNCQISVTEALESLMTLELSGFIQSCGNQNYCRKM